MFGIAGVRETQWIHKFLKADSQKRQGNALHNAVVARRSDFLLSFRAWGNGKVASREVRCLGFEGIGILDNPVSNLGSPERCNIATAT